MTILALVCLMTLTAATIGNGSKNVTTAGEAVPLVSDSKSVSEVTVQALESNTGSIFVGDSSVADGLGMEIPSLSSYTYRDLGRGTYYDLADIYVDAAVDGEGVTFNYEIR